MALFCRIRWLRHFGIFTLLLTSLNCNYVFAEETAIDTSSYDENQLVSTQSFDRMMQSILVITMSGKVLLTMMEQLRLQAEIMLIGLKTGFWKSQKQ